MIQRISKTALGLMSALLLTHLSASARPAPDTSFYGLGLGISVSINHLNLPANTYGIDRKFQTVWDSTAMTPERVEGYMTIYRGDPNWSNVPASYFEFDVAVSGRWRAVEISENVYGYKFGFVFQKEDDTDSDRRITINCDVLKPIKGDFNVRPCTVEELNTQLSRIGITLDFGIPEQW